MILFLWHYPLSEKSLEVRFNQVILKRKGCRLRIGVHEGPIHGIIPNNNLYQPTNQSNHLVAA